MKNNALQIIYPYKYNKSWVFDDETTKLVKEPFVLGIDTILDMKTGYTNKDNSEKIKVIFSGTGFPGSNRLIKDKMESGGAWYTDENTNMKGWLCPATLHYFPEHPKEIHYKIITDE